MTDIVTGVRTTEVWKENNVWNVVVAEEARTDKMIVDAETTKDNSFFQNIKRSSQTKSWDDLFFVVIRIINFVTQE